MLKGVKCGESRLGEEVFFMEILCASSVEGLLSPISHVIDRNDCGMLVSVPIMAHEQPIDVIINFVRRTTRKPFFPNNGWAHREHFNICLRRVGPAAIYLSLPK